MDFRDYITAVKEDAISAINNGDYDNATSVDHIIDNMWIDDRITGNGSGSYTFSAYTAKNNVANLIWDDEFIDKLSDMDIDLSELIKRGAESVDVTARCLALLYIRDDVQDAYNDRHNPNNWNWHVSLTNHSDTPYVVTAYYNGPKWWEIARQEFCSTLDDVYQFYLDTLYDYSPID